MKLMTGRQQSPKKPMFSRVQSRVKSRYQFNKVSYMMPYLQPPDKH